MKKYIIGGIIIAVLLVGTYLINNSKTQPNQTADNKLPTLTVGLPTAPGMALVMVAEDKGFDTKNGIDMQIKEFTAGKLALQAFLGDSLDVVISGDTPIMFATMQGNKLLITGQVVNRTIDATRIVAIKDNATSSKQYFSSKKRKLATSIGGGPEFFTYEFLKAIDIPDSGIEIISQQPADMTATLANGSVDAIAIFDPFASFAEKALGGKAITFTNSKIYSELYVINAHESIKNNPIVMEKFLQALIDAEQFTRNNSDEAKKIVMKYTKLDRDTIDKIWDKFDFKITLTPELITSLNKQAQWAVDTKKVNTNTKIPNFKELIYDAPLKKIAPDAVKI